MPNHRMVMPSDSAGRVSANRRRWIPAFAVVILAPLALLGHAVLTARSAVLRPVELGVPAYVFPGQPPLVTLQTMNPAPGIVILNPDNGDAQFSASWQAQADQLRARGITVLGYVHTDYATRPLAQVETSISNYFQSVAGPTHVSGIFLDNMSSSCSTEAYYATLDRYIHSIDPVAFVAANPGMSVNACFMRGASVADTFVTFEHDAATYISGYKGNVVAQNGAVSSGAQYPAARFWHLIYGAASSQMSQLIALASARHAGYVYVTDGDLPNPWDSVASYIVAEAMAAAHPGQAGSSPILPPLSKSAAP
jgi:Spherulation-specific family 4